jgi:Fe-S-cluster-containing hydrogenase component 2
MGRSPTFRQEVSVTLASTKYHCAVGATSIIALVLASKFVNPSSDDDFAKNLPLFHSTISAAATVRRLDMAEFPVKCRHCDPAPCQQACPTGAIYRDASFDLVLIDAEKCTSCAICAMVGPFDALIRASPSCRTIGELHRAARRQRNSRY